MILPRLCVPIAALGALAAPFGPSPGATAQGPAVDTAAVFALARPEIDEANRISETGFRRRAARMIAAAYADNGRFVAPDGGVARGRAAIRRMYAARLAAGRTG